MARPGRNLDDLYLPSMFRGDTTLETPSNYYIFDGILDPGVLQDLRTSNGHGGWQRASVAQTQMMEEITQLQQDAAKWRRTCLKLTNEKCALGARLVAMEEQNQQLRQILKDEGIEPDDVTVEQCNEEDGEVDMTDVAYQKDTAQKSGKINGEQRATDESRREDSNVVTTRDLDALQRNPLFGPADEDDSKQTNGDLQGEDCAAFMNKYTTLA